MKGLTDILYTFDKNRTADWGSELWIKSDDACRSIIVADWFKDIAFEVLNRGYINIDNKFGIEPLAVELYYIEEDKGGYRDPIMYHINKRRPIVFEDNGINFEYFKFGSLHLHTSGVDVTFENPFKHYRASFLIREMGNIRIMASNVRSLGSLSVNNSKSGHPLWVAVFCYYGGLLACFIFSDAGYNTD